MNLYLLRVGADTNFYSHINEDGSYIFIPIPAIGEYLRRHMAMTYHGYRWCNQSVVGYLPERIAGIAAANQYVHNDPEFETFTYGAPEYNGNGNIEKNFRRLAEMNQGDILLFYAAFSRHDHDHAIHGYYFFAYFIVDSAIPYRHPADLTEEQRLLVKRNHHYIHGLENQIIVKGNRQESKVFHRAVLLSSHDRRNGGNYLPCQEIAGLLNYKKPMNRAAIRKFTRTGIAESFRQYLDDAQL